MFPFEFTVPGPPLSHQTRDRKKLEAWRQFVRTSASTRWVHSDPSESAVRIVVTYYHEGETVRIDNDNLLKPIQDALNGLVYRDDRQISDTAVRKTSVDNPVRVPGMPRILYEAFVSCRSFIHVRIEEAPDHSDLMR